MDTSRRHPLYARCDSCGGGIVEGERHWSVNVHQEQAEHGVIDVQLGAWTVQVANGEVESRLSGVGVPAERMRRSKGVLDSDEPAVGMLRVTRHPFLWGVALWGACHFLANPDAPSLLFFGSLLTLAVLGPLSIDAKRRRVHGGRWERFAAVTSNVPFAAIAGGRNRFVAREVGVWRIALGAVLYGVFLAIHPWLFGASPLP